MCWKQESLPAESQRDVSCRGMQTETCLPSCVRVSLLQMYYDDLPIWGFIGKAEQEPAAEGENKGNKYFLFTHIHFEIFYNGERVILRW